MGRPPSFKVVRGAADALAKEWCSQQPNVTLISVPVNWGDLSHPDALICTRADGSKYDSNGSLPNFDSEKNDRACRIDERHARLDRLPALYPRIVLRGLVDSGQVRPHPTVL
jgi:hypothetical protein